MGTIISQLLFQPPQWHGLARPHQRVTYHTACTRLGSRLVIAHVNFGHALTILYSHGNAEDLSTVSNWLLNDFCPTFRVNAIAYDFSGYGESTGAPTEANLFADIETVYRFARERIGLQPESLVIMGCSLGSAPSVYLAAQLATCGLSDAIVADQVAASNSSPPPSAAAASAYAALPDVGEFDQDTRRPNSTGSSLRASTLVPSAHLPQSTRPRGRSSHSSLDFGNLFFSQTSGASYAGEGARVRGMVLISPLLSALRVSFNWRWSLPGDVFCSVDRMPLVRTATLILHGQIDEIVPFWHGLELYQLCEVATEPVWLPAAQHNNVLQFKEAVEALRRFFHSTIVDQGGSHAVALVGGGSINSASGAGGATSTPVPATRARNHSGLLDVAQKHSLDWQNWDGVPRKSALGVTGLPLHGVNES